MRILIASTLGLTFAMAAGSVHAQSAPASSSGEVQVGTVVVQPQAVPQQQVPPTIVAQPTVVQQQPQYYYPGMPMPGMAPMRYPGLAVPYRGGPVPQGAHLERLPIRGLVIGGAVTFGSVYLVNLITATIVGPSDGSGWWLMAPVVGPIGLAASLCNRSSSGCGSILPLMVLDTITQAAGVIMFITGLAVTQQHVVFDTYGRNNGVRWFAGPGAAGAPLGFTLGGQHF